MKEVAVADAHVVGRGRAGAPAQDHLVAHELAVVLADRTGGDAKAGVGRVGAGGPLPDVAEHLREPADLVDRALVGARLHARARKLGRTRRQEVALAGELRRRSLPLGLARQACARPARERVGLVVAKVTDGRVEVDRLEPVEGEVLPRVELAGSLVEPLVEPVIGRSPSVLLDGVPALGQPQLGPAVARVGHEREVLAVGRGPAGDREGLEPDAVARAFVVEPERRRVAEVAADLDQPARILDPAQRRSRARRADR